MRLKKYEKEIDKEAEIDVKLTADAKLTARRKEKMLKKLTKGKKVKIDNKILKVIRHYDNYVLFDGGGYNVCILKNDLLTIEVL